MPVSNQSMRDRQQLALVLILLLTLSGCDTSRLSSQSIQSDNGRFMDLWGTYTHCFQGEDLDAMRTDAERLIQAAHTTGSVEDSILRESRESIRLSVDPATMAAACALRAGQAAREMGRLYVAQEMFHTIVVQFPQPRYQYYTAQALLGLEHLMR
jgi:hypothetical protein